MKANRVVLDEQLRLLRSSYSTADFDAYADDDEEDAAPIPPRTISNVVKKRKYLLTVVKKMGWAFTSLSTHKKPWYAMLYMIPICTCIDLKVTLLYFTFPFCKNYISVIVNIKLREGIQTTMGRQAQRAILEQLEAAGTLDVSARFMVKKNKTNCPTKIS